MNLHLVKFEDFNVFSRCKHVSSLHCGISSFLLSILLHQLKYGPILYGYCLRYDEMASKYNVEYIAGGYAFWTFVVGFSWVPTINDGFYAVYYVQGLPKIQSESRRYYCQFSLMGKEKQVRFYLIINIMISVL